MNDEMLVPKNTIITCYNCGFIYEIQYSKPLDDDGHRICDDCIEGLGKEDLPVGI